ncbi:hypothetical protein CcCBS67573_g06405 [Chytriomyces confervae]|uniref:Protein kinase domain-containing protein n=1 Tax=Chytriomyces confervae TaxID=246404 RepID=A0A507F3G0_9FUNG|nr:hypothetical protein HDU80_011319 [Chytriomyces hyalinus]TPX70781.1 hypothetical protein CcCBS67573_g06405 [Chytriomyces confervae]
MLLHTPPSKGTTTTTVQPIFESSESLPQTTPATPQQLARPSSVPALQSRNQSHCSSSSHLEVPNDDAAALIASLVPREQIISTVLLRSNLFLGREKRAPSITEKSSYSRSTSQTQSFSQRESSTGGSLALSDGTTGLRRKSSRMRNSGVLIAAETVVSPSDKKHAKVTSPESFLDSSSLAVQQRRSTLRGARSTELLPATRGVSFAESETERQARNSNKRSGKNEGLDQSTPPNLARRKSSLIDVPQPRIPQSALKPSASSAKAVEGKSSLNSVVDTIPQQPPASDKVAVVGARRTSTIAELSGALVLKGAATNFDFSEVTEEDEEDEEGGSSINDDNGYAPPKGFNPETFQRDFSPTQDTRSSFLDTKDLRRKSSLRIHSASASRRKKASFLDLEQDSLRPFSAASVTITISDTGGSLDPVPSRDLQASTTPDKRSMPFKFNLEKMMSGSLLNQLQYARYERLVYGIVAARDGKLPKRHSTPTFKVPKESQGIYKSVLRQNLADANRKSGFKSWEKSRQWAKQEALKCSNALGEDPLNWSSRGNAGGSGVNSRLVSPKEALETSVTVLIRKVDKFQGEHGLIQPQDVVLPVLEKYSSRAKALDKPKLGRGKKIVGAEGGKVVRSPMNSGGGSSADKEYDISDFIVIRKVNQHIRQVVLASIPAVRRHPYAMKLVLKSKLRSKSLIESIRRERDIHKPLNNRFIQQLLATFQTAKRLYSIMEWCPQTLDSVMGFQRNLREDQCRFYVAELVLALEYLHARNVIHRGIEPENILLDALGHIKISDLSTSFHFTDADNKTDNVQCLRITRYTSPEIILHERHGKATDWFSIGTILYEMLTGNIPFGQGNVIDTLAAQYGGNNVARKRSKSKTMDRTSTVRRSTTTQKHEKGQKSGRGHSRESRASRSSRVEGDIVREMERESVANRRSSGTRERKRQDSVSTDKRHADDARAANEKVHFVAGIALTGKSAVVLPYLYRNLTEHYNVSRPAEDIVRRLMDPDHARRITSVRGTIDVKSHPWFRPLNLTWKEIEEGKMKPQYEPGIDEDDTLIAQFMRDRNGDDAANVGAVVQAANGKVGKSPGDKSGNDRSIDLVEDDDAGSEQGEDALLEADVDETELAHLTSVMFQDW